jgi:release factor glutamine methyltransferase
VGQVFFNGLRLGTEPGQVMMPRPATELLVAAALERLGDSPARVADVGTGSGAIAIAVATRASHAEVWATDTNPIAVALAGANVCRHGLANRITVCGGNLLEPVPGVLDLVVANLPYLPVADEERFADLASEPRDAVFADGDGLDLYRQLIAASRERLTCGGAVVVQFHRRVLAATRSELTGLELRLEEVLREETPLPLAA